MNIPPKVTRKKVRDMMSKKYKPRYNYQFGRGADVIMGVGVFAMVAVLAIMPFKEQVMEIAVKVIELV